MITADLVLSLVTIDVVGTGVKLDAVRATPTDEVKCPAPGCSETFIDYRRLTEHIKALHTLPVSVTQGCWCLPAISFQVRVSNHDHQFTWMYSNKLMINNHQ